MQPEDVAAIVQIETKTSPHPWRENQFHESLKRHHCYVMTDGESLMGFMIYTLIGPESEILNIAIHPNHHGKGYGGELLDYLIDAVSKTAQRLYLEVRASNSPAIRLYQNAGFAEICVRHDYYQTAHGREDAIMMALELSSSMTL